MVRLAKFTEAYSNEGCGDDVDVVRLGDPCCHGAIVERFDFPNQGGAKSAADDEHALTVKNALRLYWKAVGFSVLFSTAVIMTGYCLSLDASLLAMPSYKNARGNEPDPDNGGLAISAYWQSALKNGAQVCSRHFK